MIDAIVVQTTVETQAQADQIAQTLVEQRLAACVQISPVRSYYVWDGEISNESEQLLSIKTLSSRFDAICSTLRDLHPYVTPEILALPVLSGDGAYLAWLEAAASG